MHLGWENDIPKSANIVECFWQKTFDDMISAILDYPCIDKCRLDLLKIKEIRSLVECFYLQLKTAQ